MIIDNLNTLPTPVQSTDEIPIERGTSTYKMPYSVIEDSIAQSTATIEVNEGTVTTSANGTAGLTKSYSTNDWACLCVFAKSAVTGHIFTPFKYGDSAGGNWGFRATTNTGSVLASQSVSYVAIMYKYK